MAVIEQLGNLEYKITLNTTDLEKGQKKATSVMSRLNGALGTLANLHQATQGIKSFAQLLIGMGTDVIKAATTMDSLDAGLRAVAGGAAQADAQMIKLREVAKLPGLGLQEAVQGAINLQAAGLSAEQAATSLRAFGNALATVGKGKAELDGVVLALTQMQAKGKLSAEEINQIAERVPQIRKVMTEAFGTAIPKEIEKMGISVEAFIDTVNTQLLKLPQMVGGAANTFENLGDTIFEAKSRLGELFLPAVLSAAESFADSLQVINDALTPLSEEVSTNIDQWESMKDQWEAQDDEIKTLVKRYEKLRDELGEVTEAGGDTFRISEDLEKVNKRLIKLVPQLGTAYNKENKEIKNLNTTLERHREVKGRLIRQKFRENLDQTLKSITKSSDAETKLIQKRQLQITVAKRLADGTYELGERTGRYKNVQTLVNTETGKSTTLQLLLDAAMRETGVTVEESNTLLWSLKDAIKANVSIEQALGSEINTTNDEIGTQRDHIEKLQGSVRTYVETSGKEAIDQFNELHGIYKNLVAAQGENFEANAEYDTKLKALAVTVGLTSSVLEQGLGAAITVVKDKAVEATEADYDFTFKVKVPTEEEVAKEIKDFTSKVKTALEQVGLEAKTEGIFDPEQVMKDQLALLNTLIEAEGISEETLKEKYVGLYAARANLREDFKVLMEKKADDQAKAELKSTTTKLAAQDAAERVVAGEHQKLVDARVAGEQAAAEAEATAWEDSIEKRLGFESELTGLMLEYQGDLTKAERDSLNDRLQAFKDRNVDYIAANVELQGEIATVDGVANSNQILRAVDRDDELLKEYEAHEDRITADKLLAEQARALIDVTADEGLQNRQKFREEAFRAQQKETARQAAEDLDGVIGKWQDLGDVIVSLGDSIDTNLGKQLDEAFGYGQAFLSTMQAVQMAMAGTGSWFTVAAAGISYINMAIGGVTNSRAAQKRRQVAADMKEISGEVHDLQKRAFLGQDYIGQFGKDLDAISDAKERLQKAEDKRNKWRPMGLAREEEIKRWMATDAEFVAAQRNLTKVQDEQDVKQVLAMDKKAVILKERIAVIEGLGRSLVGSVEDSIIDEISETKGWDNIERAIERHLMDAMFQGILHAQMARHQIMPLIEEYVAFMQEAIENSGQELTRGETRALEKRQGVLNQQIRRVVTNTKSMMDQAFFFQEWFPTEDDMTPEAFQMEAPDLTAGLSTSIRQITHQQADALSATFGQIQAINGRIADNTLRSADLLETYLPTLSGNQMMTQSTDVGASGYVSSDYAQAMALQNANRGST